MLEHMLMPYRRYADFRGRASRAEYWWFMLLVIAVLVVGYGMMFAGGMSLEPGAPEPDSPLFFAGATGMFVFLIASLVPMVAVEVRRWHDLDKSGWFWFVRFVPLVGGLIVLFFMCSAGTRGGNRFGPDPYDKFSTQTFI